MTDAIAFDFVLGLIPTLGELVLSMVIWGLCFFVGFLLTENANTALWLKLQPLLDMRPFNCRLCLTTHITLVTFLIIAYLGGWHFLYLGAAGTIWTFYILSHRDNQ